MANLEVIKKHEIGSDKILITILVTLDNNSQKYVKFYEENFNDDILETALRNLTNIIKNG